MIEIKYTHITQISFGLLILLLMGCASGKKITYFQDEEGQEINEMILNYEPRIQIGDILFINVTTIEPEAAVPFNIYDSPGGINIVPLPYIVNVDGEINFPVLGKIKVSETTTKQLTNKLTQLLLPYLKKPVINIRLDNFKVSVLGEVRVPGSYPVLNERISIIEAIALAGDLTIYGNRKTVTLIREQNGKRTFTPIDLTNKELFNSPYYYLAQNDVIYVEPNRTKINSSVIGPNTGVIISIASILITLTAIFVR
jgi:polysaccharide export outer membrane protein